MSNQGRTPPDAHQERAGFNVELPQDAEERFLKWVGVAEMTDWQRSVARLALLLNTTNRGLIDYDAAQHFANELIARTSANLATLNQGQSA